MRYRASLSGAGARLAFHAGVLARYAESGWECQQYRGTSGGGLVALFAACGRLDWLSELVLALRSDALYASAGVWGLLRGHRYTLDPFRRLLKRTGALHFEVRVPCELVVYDLLAGASRRIACPVGSAIGDNLDALCGTIAIPGLFEAAHGGAWVDGGVAELIPAIGDGPSGSEPWVVSVATSLQAPVRAMPPRWLGDILETVLAGVMAETARNDLERIRPAAEPVGLRLHVLPDAHRYDALRFDPAVSRELYTLGHSLAGPIRAA